MPTGSDAVESENKILLLEDGSPELEEEMFQPREKIND